MALNSFYQSIENMNTLKCETEKDIIRIFVVPANRQQVLMRLEELLATSQEFKSILDVCYP